MRSSGRIRPRVRPRRSAGWARHAAVVVATITLHVAAPACDDTGAFRRGDATCDTHLNITDAIFVLQALFTAAPSPSCPDAADANDDGRVNISDAVAILTHLFIQSHLPDEISRDLTPDGLGCLSGHPPCPGVESVASIGQFQSMRIFQPSGGEISERHHDILWIVNDSDAGRDPTLYALRTGGEIVASYRLSAAPETCPFPPEACDVFDKPVHCDWEGLALGPDENGKPTIFIGDTGGNRAPRVTYAIHRVPEPDDVSPGPERELTCEAGDFDTLFFDVDTPGDFDAEALFVDPGTAAIYVIGQAPRCSLYRYPSPQRPGEIVTLELVTHLPICEQGNAYISSADIAPDSSSLLVKLWLAGWDGAGECRVLRYPWNAADPAASLGGEPTCEWFLEEYFGTLTFPFHAGAVTFDTATSFLSFEENSFSEIVRVTLRR